MNFEEERRKLIDGLVKAGIIEDARVRQAMMSVQRHIFVPERSREHAYIDRPLDIGFGQTISAPHMVAIMASMLDLRPGMRVLEVGGGSGYHAAVMAELVRPGGKIFSVETIKDLAETAKTNLARSGQADIVEVIAGDGSKGLPEKAPFDRISVAAAAPDVPGTLIGQLAEGGIMLIPVGSLLSQELIMVKKVDGRAVQMEICGVMFVPLVGEHGHKV